MKVNLNKRIMNKKGFVYCNKDLAGILQKNNEGYIFEYTDEYFNNPDKKAISITIQKTQKSYTSKILFPFFFNMLAEGANKALQCKWLKIDEEDHYSLLLATGSVDTIGAVYVTSEFK